MRNLVLLSLALFAIPAAVRPETAESKGYLTENRLQYHGYFYKNDVLGNEAELKEVREFANMLVFSLIHLEDPTPETIRIIASGEWGKLDLSLFDGAAERIDLLRHRQGGVPDCRSAGWV